MSSARAASAAALEAGPTSCIDPTAADGRRIVDKSLTIVNAFGIAASLEIAA
jgi:hypothetical protein